MPMDQELIAYLDQRFREISQQIQELRESDRHIMVVVEGLDDKVDMLAEVVAAHDEKTARGFETLRSELGQEIADTRSLLKQSYSDLDRRVKRLEAKAS